MSNKRKKDAIDKRSRVTNRKVGFGNRRRFKRWLKLPYVILIIIILLGLQSLLAGSTLVIGPDDEYNQARNTAKTGREIKALILTAHPDDEVMFFSPAIFSLLKSNVKVFGLCLSNGNGDGLGKERSNEFLESYITLGVHSNQTLLVNDIHLQDGMQVYWNPQRIFEHVDKLSQQIGKFDFIFTFDRGGVSGHANHKACASTVSLFQNSNILTENGKIYTLKTFSILFKFLGLPGALLRQIVAKFLHKSPNQIAFLSNPLEYIQSLKAMAKHKTQLVWFRYLYVLFSSYMYGGQFELFVNI